MPAPFDVLVDPNRRRILDLLRTGDRTVGQLTELLGLTQPGTSKHLRVLRDAGLVRVRQDAQRRWYELRLEPLMELDEWLTPYRWLWAARLDALERHLDTMPDEPAAGGGARGNDAQGDNDRGDNDRDDRDDRKDDA